MELDSSTRVRLIRLLQQNLAGLYEAASDKEKEWDEIEEQRKDAIHIQDAIEGDQKRIANQITECRDLLTSLNEME